MLKKRKNNSENRKTKKDNTNKTNNGNVCNNKNNSNIEFELKDDLNDKSGDNIISSDSDSCIDSVIDKDINGEDDSENNRKDSKNTEDKNIKGNTTSNNIGHENKNNKTKKKKSEKNKSEDKKNNDSKSDIRETKRYKRVLKKIFNIFLGILISSIIGFIICFIVFKDDIYKQSIKDNCFSYITAEGKIVATSEVIIEGKEDDKSFSKNLYLESRLKGNNFYYSKQDDNGELYNGYNLNELYIDNNYVYIKDENDSSNRWIKVNFHDVFGESSEPYMLFGIPLNVDVSNDSKLSSDNNCYYIEQNISLEEFFRYLGESDVNNSTSLQGIFGSNFDYSKYASFVTEKMTFNKSDYGIKELRFSFKEPIKIDDNNSIKIELILTYSLGTDHDYTVPDNIKEAKEIKAEDFLSKEDKEIKDKINSKASDEDSSIIEDNSINKNKSADKDSSSNKDSSVNEDSFNNDNSIDDNA